MQQNRLQPRSACDSYDCFTGWENKDASSTNNILKHFRNNLHSYEDQYNSSKDQRKRRQHRKLSTKLVENKENEVKLPTVNSAQLTQQLSRKGSFLVLKNRNILKEAYENTIVTRKKQHLIIHQTNSKPKLKPISNSRNQLSQQKLKVQPEILPKTENLIKKRVVSRAVHHQLKDSLKERVQSRAEGAEEECEFNDSKLVYCSNHPRFIDMKLRRQFLKQQSLQTE